MKNITLFIIFISGSLTPVYGKVFTSNGNLQPSSIKGTLFTAKLYNGDAIYYMGHANPGDTIAGWFHPFGPTKIILANFMFNSSGNIHIFIWKADSNFTDSLYYDVHNGDTANGGNPPGPSPIGENLLSVYGYPDGIPVTIDSTKVGKWDTINFVSILNDTIDMGMNDFFIGYVLDGGADHPYDPSIFLDAGETTPYYHSLCYLSDPNYANNQTPGWWAYGCGYFIECLVDIYNANPPPYVNLKKKSDTYSTSSITIQASISDAGYPTDSAGVDTAFLYYSVNSGPIDSIGMTMVSGDSIDGVYESQISGQSVGDTIHYYVLATDIQGAKDDLHIVSRYFYIIRAGTPGAKLLFVNGDEYYGNGYTYDAIKQVYPQGDTWNIKKFNGPPDSSVIMFPDYQLIVWITWPGKGFIEDTSIIKKYFDSGKSMLISSQDLIGELLGGVYTDTILNNGFIYNYLKVREIQDDKFSNGTDSSQMFGIPGDPISGDFQTGFWIYPYAFSPGHNFYGVVHPRTDISQATIIFDDIDGNPTGYKYDGIDYKLVYLYWPYYYITKNGSPDSPDTSAQITLLTNILKWFGILGVQEHTTKTNDTFSITSSISAHTFTLDFFNKHPEYLDINVYNILGQKVENLFKGKIGPGYHKINFGKRLHSGIYFLYIKHSNEILREKLTKIE